MAERFTVRWDEYQSNIVKCFKSLRSEDSLFDVTLVSDDQTQIAAHKLVLSASSEYFKNIFKKNKHSHPLLCLSGIRTQDVKNILDFIYNGEVQLLQDDLYQFMEVAQRFKLEGLTDIDEPKVTYRSYQTILEPKVMPDEFSENKDSLSINRELSEEVVESKNSAYGTSHKNSQVSAINSDSFTSLDELKEIVKEEITKDEDGMWRCKRCPKVSRMKSHITDHVETHLEGISFPCNLCDKSYKMRDTLRSHVKRKHKDVSYRDSLVCHYLSL